MNSHDSLTPFLDKYRARWPEWAVAETFVPPPQRTPALAWVSLLQELTDAAWGGSDPRPGEAKLGWWQEELAGWSRGARRHPLGQTLQSLPAPWAGLARALPALASSRERMRDADEAFAVLGPFCAAVVAVESVLFDAVAADGQAADTVGASLLAARFQQAGEGLLPLAVLAQAGEGGGQAGRRLWAAQLLRNWPRPAGGTRPRRLWAALARARLKQADPARPLPAWRAVFVAWRGAMG